MKSSTANPYRSGDGIAPALACKVTTRKQQNIDRARDARGDDGAKARERSGAVLL